MVLYIMDTNKSYLVEIITENGYGHDISDDVIENMEYAYEDILKYDMCGSYTLENDSAFDYIINILKSICMEESWKLEVFSEDIMRYIL